MRKIKNFWVPVVIILLVPAISFAAGLVPDCSPNCTWVDLMDLINTVINFILLKLVVPIAAIMFAYAGFLMVTAGGEAAHARTKAKNIFINVVVGFIIALAAWLLVSTFLAILGYDGTWIGLIINI